MLDHIVVNQEPLPERRTAARQRMYKSATLSPDGRTSVFDCVVRDFGEAGARIKIPDPHLVPSNLVFNFKDNPEKRSATVIWRSQQELGLHFSY